ncbi:MAG: 50S ribosomal protein L4 [Candidatus Limnocylindria bacterium]
MAELTLLRPGAKPSGKVELSDALFAAPVNESLIHQAVVRQMNNRRLGTSDTLTRGLVSGGGKKPWRQKGTGRARQGSRRAPQWKGGGVVFGPHPRSHRQDMPARMRRAALRGVLSAKQSDGRVAVVEGFGLDGIKTRALRDRLSEWDLTGKVLLVVAERDEVLERSARNLEQVTVLLADSLNVVDLLAADSVVFTRAALERAHQVYR